MNHTNADLLRISARSDNWAVISHDGKLTKFDNSVCRAHAERFAVADQIDQSAAIAKLCMLLLSKAAEIVEHIPYQNGTYGDLIRNLNIDMQGDA